MGIHRFTPGTEAGPITATKLRCAYARADPGGRR
jgi:hypothetical protein